MSTAALLQKGCPCCGSLQNAIAMPGDDTSDGLLEPLQSTMLSKSYPSSASTSTSASVDQVTRESSVTPIVLPPAERTTPK